MRNLIIPCLRNLKSQRLIMGFEVSDFFLILGIGLGLQSIYGNSTLIWLIVLSFGVVIRFIKRRTAPGVIWHFLCWFFRPKKYTAIEQTKGAPGKKG
jgi:hypothetical protein